MLCLGYSQFLLHAAKVRSHSIFLKLRLSLRISNEIKVLTIAINEIIIRQEISAINMLPFRSSFKFDILGSFGSFWADSDQKK